MGRRGPKPQPASVKQAKGNPGHRPIGADPDASATPGQAETYEKATAVAVEAPVWLKAEGRKVWDRLAPRLVAMKLLSPIDAEAFGRYCRSFARWEKMQRVLDEEGETYESESQHGKLKRAHPAFLISDRLERQLLATEDRFGLNPAERQRLYAARAAQPALPGDLFGGLPVGHPPAGDKRPRGEQRPSVSPDRSGPSSPVGFLN
jgi:P27 family predicted phage terminase small subunit